MKQLNKVIALLLAMTLVLSMGMVFGTSQARYNHSLTWQSVYYPSEPKVTSNRLSVDGVTVLLKDWVLEPGANTREYKIRFYATTDNIYGMFSCSTNLDCVQASLSQPDLKQQKGVHEVTLTLRLTDEAFLLTETFPVSIHISLQTVGDYNKQLWADYVVDLVPQSVQEETTVPTEVPEETTAPTEVPEETTAPTEVPEETTAPTEVPEETTAPTEVPEETTAPTEVPEETTAPTEVPEETTAPTEVPEETTVATAAAEETTLPEENPVAVLSLDNTEDTAQTEETAENETTAPSESETTTPPSESEVTTPPSESEMTTALSESEPTTAPSESEPTTTPSESETTTAPSESETTNPPSESETTTALSESETTTAPSESETTTALSESETTTPPSESETTIPPSESETTTPPSESETTTPPSESETTTPPSESETTTAPSESETTTPPSESETTTPPSESETTTPPSESETTTPPAEQDPTEELQPLIQVEGTRFSWGEWMSVKITMPKGAACVELLYNGTSFPAGTMYRRADGTNVIFGDPMTIQLSAEEAENWDVLLNFKNIDEADKTKQMSVTASASSSAARQIVNTQTVTFEASRIDMEDVFYVGSEAIIAGSGETWVACKWNDEAMEWHIEHLIRDANGNLAYVRSDDQFGMTLRLESWTTALENGGTEERKAAVIGNPDGTAAPGSYRLVLSRQTGGKTYTAELPFFIHYKALAPASE